MPCASLWSGRLLSRVDSGLIIEFVFVPAMSTIWDLHTDRNTCTCRISWLADWLVGWLCNNFSRARALATRWISLFGSNMIFVLFICFFRRTFSSLHLTGYCVQCARRNTTHRQAFCRWIQAFVLCTICCELWLQSGVCTSIVQRLCFDRCARRCQIKYSCYCRGHLFIVSIE